MASTPTKEEAVSAFSNVPFASAAVGALMDKVSSQSTSTPSAGTATSGGSYANLSGSEQDVKNHPDRNIENDPHLQVSPVRSSY